MRPLIPALQRIQHQFGYLNREALQQFSDDSGVPLYRLHTVASFFPHFQLTPPKPVRLRICRDMACQMAGSWEMLRELGPAAGEHIAVEGVSCLGRCDRAPAACVAVTGSEHEYFYHGRSANELRRIAEIGSAASLSRLTRRLAQQYRLQSARGRVCGARPL